MNVFVTGATGWVGSAVVKELLASGHQVTGLVRSADKAASLASAGASVVHASLDDSDTLRHFASLSDAVVHTAFNHDFSKFAENAEQDRRAIEVMGSALTGSDRPLIVTSGLSGLALGATEGDRPDPGSLRLSENAAATVATQGVYVATVRLAPSVHGSGDHGFIPILIRLAKEKGVSAYLDDGKNCWSGVYREDAARVYRLALEHGVKEKVYHAVADEAVPFRAIAEAIGTLLGLPVESRSREHFGWFAGMAGADMSVSSVHTRKVLNWTPQGPGLLKDLQQSVYHPD